MTNWHVEERLTAYLANEVSVEEKEFLESHLEICAQCRQEYELMQELDWMLDQLTLEDPGAEFADAVMAKLAEREAPTLLARPASFWRGTDFRNMVASIVAAFVLFQGFAGILPNVPRYDTAITEWTVIAKLKMELWVADMTRTFER